MIKEIWKDIVNYEGIYQISNLGRIKSLAREIYLPKRNIIRKLKDTILSPKTDKQPYHNVNLYKDYKPKLTRVHVLVAETFIPNPNNKPFVNHINGIKKDNRVENLEWVTHYENMTHAFNTGLIPNGERNHKSKLTDNDVIEIKDLYIKNPNLNQSELARKYQVTRSTINGIIKNRKWRFVNKEQKS